MNHNGATHLRRNPIEGTDCMSVCLFVRIRLPIQSVLNASMEVEWIEKVKMYPFFQANSMINVLHHEQGQKEKVS